MTSRIFDQIRIKPTRERQKANQASGNRRDSAGNNVCAHPECEAKATHKAPRGRSHNNEYLWFCLKHVREYNKSYNYFSGMDDDAISKFRKEAIVGHRPTWKMGVNGSGDINIANDSSIHDPFKFIEHETRQANKDTLQKRKRKILNVERNALETLGLDGHASQQEIKERFKLLVKKHHPDVNGGDKTSEDRLRDVIQAYNYLKSVGLC